MRTMRRRSALFIAGLGIDVHRARRRTRDRRAARQGPARRHLHGDVRLRHGRSTGTHPPRQHRTRQLHVQPARRAERLPVLPGERLRHDVYTNLDNGGTYTDVFTANSRTTRSWTTVTAPSRSSPGLRHPALVRHPRHASSSRTPATSGSPSTSTTTAPPATRTTTRMFPTRSGSSATPPGSTSWDATSARTCGRSPRGRHPGPAGAAVESTGGHLCAAGSSRGAADGHTRRTVLAVSHADWFVCPVEPSVRHLVPAVVAGGAPSPALCLVESPAWQPLHDTDGTSRPCPLCAAAAAQAGRNGPPHGVRPDGPPLSWGQPGDVRGR